MSFTETQLEEIAALVKGTKWFVERNKEIRLGPIPVNFNSIFVGTVVVETSTSPRGDESNTTVKFVPNIY